MKTVIAVVCIYVVIAVVFPRQVNISDNALLKSEDGYLTTVQSYIQSESNAQADESGGEISDRAGLIGLGGHIVKQYGETIRQSLGSLIYMGNLLLDTYIG
ncbi:hypothetical protein L9F63_022904 [Diploptera punctata]|uniref:Uncharacterized protein n=1 Tax=Diploptera punctata TaxID=6984 RepID=A0AAD7ZL83_DIPPU|nr:hypothetical protein L9F63_022904 [Diploptera punctata]